jgi:hypothetical protein
MPHPPPPFRAPYGTHWKITVESPRTWRVLRERACRYVTGPKHATCGKESAAAVSRGRRGHVMWFAYCAEHAAAHGRWVQDGHVWSWSLAPGAHPEPDDPWLTR